MEHAVWNGQQLSASKVGQEYAYEKEVRRASRNKELFCQDPICKKRALKYCHGKIKLPYFAHVEKADCDYAMYENGRSEAIYNLCNRVNDILVNKGFWVEKEKKLLPHHYSHLVLADEDGTMTALEILKKSLNVKTVDELLSQYQSQGIGTTWIELGDVRVPVMEKQTFFAERFALNEGNKVLVIVDKDLQHVTQYRTDPNHYEYRGVSIFQRNELLMWKGELEQLTFENSCIQLEGSEVAYEQALAERKASYERQCRNIDERRERQREEERHQQYLIEQRKKIEKKYHSNQQVAEKSQKPAIVLSGGEYDEINRTIEEANYVVTNSKDERVVKCSICGKLGYTADFASYGGPGSINIGKCNDCVRGLRVDKHVRINHN